MSRFRFRPRARADLEEIWECGAAAWGADRAERYVRQIERTMRMLAENPTIGRSCDSLRTGYRKHRAGSHLIFYRIVGEGIEVVRILHSRMDFERRL